MMFDYTPKLPELIFYPLVAVEVAHGLALALPTEYQGLCVAAVAVNCALLPVVYLWKESCKYIDGMSAGDTPKQQQVTPAKVYLDMNKADAAGNVFAHNVKGIKFDARRNLARALWGEWEHHQEIDVTETAWLKARVNSVDPRRKLPKRWQGKDNDFRKCKQDWEQAGILGREHPDNEKSRFIVRDPERLQAIAQGRL